MPQFDKITFFNQVFWLFVFFSGSYLLLLKVFLPRLSEALKIRTKKLQKGSVGVDTFVEEQSNVSDKLKSSISATSDVVKTLVDESTSTGNIWLQKEKQGLNANSLKRSNSSFETSLYKNNAINYLLSKI